MTDSRFRIDPDALEALDDRPVARPRSTATLPLLG